MKFGKAVSVCFLFILFVLAFFLQVGEQAGLCSERYAHHANKEIHKGEVGKVLACAKQATTKFAPKVRIKGTLLGEAKCKKRKEQTYQP